MFGFVGGDMGDSGEDIRAMCGRAFNAIPMVNTTLSGFVVNIEVLKVVVKVDRTSTEVSTQEGCVGGEDGSDIYVALPAERNGDPSLPFVKMGNDGGGKLPGEILKREGKKVSADSGTREGQRTSPRNQATT
jgi:hypothetical protein